MFSKLANLVCIIVGLLSLYLGYQYFSSQNLPDNVIWWGLAAMGIGLISLIIPMFTPRNRHSLTRIFSLFAIIAIQLMPVVFWKIIGDLSAISSYLANLSALYTTAHLTLAFSAAMGLLLLNYRPRHH